MEDDVWEDGESTGILEIFRKGTLQEIDRPDGLRQGVPAL
jgi:hypothetical protein